MHTTTQLAGSVIADGTLQARLEHAALFTRIMDRIYRYFRRMLRDGHEAEECAQRTLLLLAESLQARSYDPERSFNTWMWLKARTVYAQWCRDREKRRSVERLSEQAEKAVPAPSDRIEPGEREDAARLLERLAAELGEETLEVFVLYYEGGLSQEEVAQALERDRKTVRKRIAEAHAFLERHLS